MNKIKSCKLFNIIGIICLIIGAGILVYTTRFIFSEDIWFDELFTVELSALPMRDLLKLAAGDVHPPLFYLIVRAVYLAMHTLNTNITVTIAAKLTAILPYYLILLYVSTFIRKRFGWLSAGLGFVFILIMPQMSAYMVEARMYSWAMFSVLAMFIHGMESVRGVSVPFRSTDEISYADACSHIWCFWMKGKKAVPGMGKLYANLFIAMLYAILSMYLHYYAFIGVAAVALIMLTYSVAGFFIESRRIRTWRSEEISEDGSEVVFDREHTIQIRPDVSSLIAVIVVCLIAYVPWEGAMLSQVGAVSTSYWIPPVGIRTFAGCIKYIFMPPFESSLVSVICAVAFICIVGVMLVRIVLVDITQDAESKWRKLFILSGFIATVILVLIGYIASVIIRPVFVYRYMIPVMGVLWICVGCLFGEFWNYVNQKLCVLIVIPLIMITLIGVRDFNMFRWEEQKKIQEMDNTMNAFHIIESEYHNSALVCNFNQVQALLWHYVDNESILWGETDETLIAKICDREPYLMTDDILNLRDLIAQISSRDDGFLFVGSGNARDDIIDMWQESGMQVEKIADSCLLERYYFNVYNVTW